MNDRDKMLKIHLPKVLRELMLRIANQLCEWIGTRSVAEDYA